MSPERLWHRRRLAAFDLETTAPDPLKARIVTACVVRVGGGEATEQQSWLVDPQVEIPAEATAIHGITTDHALAHGAHPTAALPQIASALRGAWEFGEPVVAMNAVYDMTVLDRELRRYGFVPLVPGPVVDPFVIDKHVDPYRKGKRTLTAACAHYRVKLDGAHDAAFDALAAARLAYRLAAMFQEIREMDLQALHEAQVRWHAEQAESLERHFRKTNPQAVCPREWPIRAAQAA